MSWRPWRNGSLRTELGPDVTGVVTLGRGTVASHGVGPKAALLDQAARRGLPVPRGVVVLDGTDPDRVVSKLAELSGSSFAVRSAFAAEDGSSESLAGWFDSKLRVPIDEVPSVIGEVRQSAARREGSFRLDVLVMEMVDARHSGVAFSEPGTYDDVVNTTSGTAERLVAGELPGERVVLPRLERASDGWPRRLQQVLQSIRSTFGDEPWDVEWADDGETCWLVQLRRVTRPTRRDEVFTIANHAEILPALPSTLMSTLIAEAGPELFDWYRRRVPSLPANRDFLEVFAGRPFINLSLLEDMLRELGLPTRLVADSIGGPPDVDRPLRPGRLVRSAPSLIRLGWAQLVAVRRVRRTCAELVALGERPADDFSSAIDALREAYVALVSGMFPLSSAIGPPLALLRRAGTLHAHASSHRTITAELATAVEDVRSGRMSLEEFLERFGHRGVYESDIARPRYRDDPSVLNVQPLSSEPMSVTRHDTEPSAPRWSWRVTATAPLWWLARKPLAAREVLRHEAMRAFAALRHTLVDLAQRATERGQLPDVDTLWTLTTEEARSLDLGRVFTGDDKTERLAKREALAKLQPPPVVRRFDDPASWDDRDTSNDGQVVWRGLSLTSGTVRGRAWVLEEPEHVLPEGWDGAATVLVARSIDAGWVTTLSLVAGVVIETGGDLSHGSILVRELGLPAVTNVRGVRRGVNSGDEVELRAQAGVVELLASSTPA